MPLQNRVTPEGDIVALPARGTFMGNRGGCFHTPRQELTRSRWKSRAWITCVLEFKNRHRELMQPGLYTELFFLDEVTALAAGHRPCFECRRGDANAFFAAWDASGRAPPNRRAGDMDLVLHAERVGDRRSKRTFRSRLDALPNGTMVRINDESYAVMGPQLLAWGPDGYTQGRPYDGNRDATVLTPPTTVRLLQAGYCPHIHKSATDLVGDHRLRQA